MRVSSLRMAQFRNYVHQEIRFRPGINFLVGENGHGKTNLIEALNLLSTGESFRPSHFDNFLFNQSVDRARLSADVDNGVGTSTFQLDFFDGRKTPTLNGKRSRFSILSTEFPIVLFSPESLSAIKSGPDERRLLIDSVLSTSSIRDSQLLADYKQALRARNRLLKDIASGDRRRSTLDSLESLTSLFLVISTHVTSSRIRVLNEIQVYWSNSVCRIFGDDDLKTTSEYLISDEVANSWDDNQIFNAISQRFGELRERELELGSSLIGPHKHDIRFLFGEKDSRFYCSQGQQRALILAFKIAQIDLHHALTRRYPLLLLDDVLSELDADKRLRLMEYLEGIKTQVLITATDLTWSRQFPEDRNAVFRVENGTVALTDPSAVRVVTPV